MPWSGSLGRVAAGGEAAALAALAGRYIRGVAEADRSWPAQVETRLSDLGEVADVSILPLVERLIPAGRRLAGEAGVSYLIQAGNTRMLFDAGLSGRKSPSALAGNAEELRVDLRNLDVVVISHLHPDHVGGLRAVRERTFRFSSEPIEPAGIPAHVPTEMQHARTDIVQTSAPRVIAPGVAVLPPLPRMLFWLGRTVEQALVVNVRGFGLVLVTGCGHPRIEQILGVTEQVLDAPIRAVVGGLHLPVHAMGTALIPQAVFGTPHWPWQPISERDAAAVLDEIDARGPQVVALSGHDSTPWTYAAFADRFGSRYRTLQVGEELRISAIGTTAGTASAAALPAAERSRQ